MLRRWFWLALLVFAPMLGLVGGCALPQDPVRYIERLQPGWESDQEWVVRQSVWPRRLQDPTTRQDTPVYTTFRMRVRSSQPAENRYRFEAWDGIDRYWLNIHGGTMESIQHLIGWREGSPQVNTIQVNRFRGGPMVLLDDPSPDQGLWFFPSLEGTRFKWRNRFPVLTSQRSTGRWYDQKAVTTEEGIRFYIENEDGSEQITIDWKRGDPWWNRLLWTRRERIIGRAWLVNDTVSTNTTNNDSFGVSN